MLAYVDAIVRENTITVDGYTTNKTERGIIKKEGYHNYFCIRFIR